MGPGDAQANPRAVDAHKKWGPRRGGELHGKAIASAADDMVCRLWAAASGRLLRELHGHAEQTPQYYPSIALFVLLFTPDGSQSIATADKVGHIVSLGNGLG